MWATFIKNYFTKVQNQSNLKFISKLISSLMHYLLGHNASH